ncbi:MAG: transcriptional regulator [Firmicutes bacterium]|nr:transcriptional regulator [Bacillota bacterium]
MGSSSIIGTMIAVCVFFVVLTVFSKPLKFVARVFANACLGVLGMALANFLLASQNFAIGINFLTAGYVGLLGFPGFISLFIIKMALK